MANFNFTPNVKCVNGTDTWIEAYFPNYVGTLGTDVTAFSITGPSGLITNNKNDIEFFEDMNYILYREELSEPEFGTYEISITIGGETLTLTDEQIINRTLPVVNNLTLSPGIDETSTTDIIFTWDAIPDPGFPVYYGIQIVSDSGEYIVNVRYIGDFQYAVNLLPGNYSWQIIVMDGIDWSNTNNRTHGNWENFTIV